MPHHHHARFGGDDRQFCSGCTHIKNSLRRAAVSYQSSNFRVESAMNEIEFSALMVSRVCHDLVGPLGAVVNGLEVLEDERDATMREDALKLVASSANQALARIQFMRIAF